MRREPSGPTLLAGAVVVVLFAGMCAGLVGMRGDILAWLEGLCAPLTAPELTVERGTSTDSTLTVETQLGPVIDTDQNTTPFHIRKGNHLAGKIAALTDITLEFSEAILATGNARI